EPSDLLVLLTGFGHLSAVVRPVVLVRGAETTFYPPRTAPRDRITCLVVLWHVCRLSCAADLQRWTFAKTTPPRESGTLATPPRVGAAYVSLRAEVADISGPLPVLVFEYSRNRCNDNVLARSCRKTLRRCLCRARIRERICCASVARLKAREDALRRYPSSAMRNLRHFVHPVVPPEFVSGVLADR